MKDRRFSYELRANLICVKVGERSFFYEQRSYLIYVKVGERSFLYELRPYLVYVEVGESAFHIGKISTPYHNEKVTFERILSW